MRQALKSNQLLLDYIIGLDTLWIYYIYGYFLRHPAYKINEDKLGQVLATVYQ